MSVGNKKRGPLFVVLGLIVLLGVGAIVFFTSKGNGSYTVTFDTDGGTSIKSKAIKDGKTISKPNDPKKENYIFVGWFIDEVEYNFEDEITKDIKLI